MIDEVDDDDAIVASMRPRFFNRGKARAWLILPAIDNRFNEAAIFQSRKALRQSETGSITSPLQ